MCGRFSFSSSKAKIQAEFTKLELDDPLKINFNVAPTQFSHVITDASPGALQLMQWGLVPHWSRDGKNNGRLINARKEGIASKPSFRIPLRKRRCLVLADSFYEWRKEGGQKIPYRILRTDESLVIMAGIWDVWTDGKRQLASFSIITTPPNIEMAPIHNRMPVIFHEKEQYQQWLEEDNLERILDLLETPSDHILKMYSVSTAVNSVKNNGAQLHKAVQAPPSLFD